MEKYIEALELAKKVDSVELMGSIRWEIYQAHQCLGRLSLPSTSEMQQCEDATPLLKNAAIMEDFPGLTDAAQIGQNVKHRDKWYMLFGTTQSECTLKEVRRAYHKLMLQLHPDKFEPQHLKYCAEEASLVVNAGFELIKEHGECAKTANRNDEL